MFPFFTIMWVLFGPKHYIPQSRTPVYNAFITENFSSSFRHRSNSWSILYIRQVGDLNRHLAALEQTLADMETV